MHHALGVDIDVVGLKEAASECEVCKSGPSDIDGGERNAVWPSFDGNVVSNLGETCQDGPERCLNIMQSGEFRGVLDCNNETC